MDTKTLDKGFLDYKTTKEIGADAADAWEAMMALCGLRDPRILAGYSFEAEAAFSSFFSRAV